MPDNSKENIDPPFTGTGGIIYNVTVKVEASIADQWISWQLNEHGPELIATGCFTSFKAMRLLDIDDTEGPTFAVQYFAQSMHDLNRYKNTFADDLKKKSFNKWGNRFIAFRTVMEVVN